MQAGKSKAAARVGDAQVGPLAGRTITAAKGEFVGNIWRSVDTRNANDIARDLFRNAIADAHVQKPLVGRKTLAITQSLTDEVHKWTRGMDEWTVNDRTRALFRKTVAEMFGGEGNIPDSVKDAMLLKDYGSTNRPIKV